ncbi:MAG: hypothetical protein PVH21_17615 [Myxococcales bacterium]
MRSKGPRFIGIAVALCVPASFASAQWDQSTQQGLSTTATTAPPPPPAPPDQMISAPPPATAPPKKGLEVSFTWSLDIGVPIILDAPHEIVRPGASIFFFGAADFGFFALGGEAGLQWNPIDFGRGTTIGGIVYSGRSPLNRFYFSLPQVRFQIPNLKLVLPYISGSFDMNFWNFRETTTGCGYWYCAQYAVYRFTPGFTGRAGLGFNIKDSGVYIDAGFQYSFTGKGDFFEQSGWWLAPYAGVLVRKR